MASAPPCTPVRSDYAPLLACSRLRRDRAIKIPAAASAGSMTKNVNLNPVVVLSETNPRSCGVSVTTTVRVRISARMSNSRWPVMLVLDQKEPVMVMRTHKRGGTLRGVDPRVPVRRRDGARRGSKDVCGNVPEWMTESWKRRVEAEARAKLKRKIRDIGKGR